MGAVHRFRHTTGPASLHSWPMVSRDKQAILLTAAFWILLGAISALQIQISMLAHHHSWPLVISYQILVWSVWIVYSFAIRALVRRAPLIPVRLGTLPIHLVVAPTFAVLHTALWVGVELWLRPYDVMNPSDFGSRFVRV